MLPAGIVCPLPSPLPRQNLRPHLCLFPRPHRLPLLPPLPLLLRVLLLPLPPLVVSPFLQVPRSLVASLSPLLTVLAMVVRPPRLCSLILFPLLCVYPVAPRPTLASALPSTPVVPFSEPPVDADAFFLQHAPPTRPRAPDSASSVDPFAVVDHLSVSDCASFGLRSCTTASFVDRSNSLRFGQAVHLVYREVADALSRPLDPGQPLRLERRLKMELLLWALLLRLPVPSSSPSTPFRQVLASRLACWHEGLWRKLVDDLDADIALAHTSDRSVCTQPDSEIIQRIRTASSYLARNQIRKAKSVLLSLGVGSATNPRVHDQLHSKHPSRASPIPLPNVDQIAASSSLPPISLATMEEVVRSLDPTSGPGLGGCRFSHLQAAFLSNSSRRGLRAFTRFSNFVLGCKVPLWYAHVYASIRLVPLNKLDPRDVPLASMDFRPVGIGLATRRVHTRALFQEQSRALRVHFLDACGPTQLGCGRQAGPSGLVFSVRALTDARPDFVVISCDIKNAFNSIHRASILEKLWRTPSLRPYYLFFHRILAPKSYIAIGGSGLVDAGFRSEEGTQQGDVAAGFLYCLGTSDANAHVDQILKADGGALVAGMDDTYLVATPAVAFPALALLREQLALVGCKLRRDKTKCYIHPKYRTPAYHAARGDISEGTIELADGSLSYGLGVYGVPFGDDSFIERWLEVKHSSVARDFSDIRSILTSARDLCTSVPVRHSLWLLIYRCFQHYGNYWCRHLPPSLTLSFSKALDSSLASLVGSCADVDLRSLPGPARSRIHLPVRFKGCGLRLLEERRFAEFIGGMVQGLRVLLDFTSISSTGTSTLHVGALSIPTLTDFFGSHCLDTASSAPWTGLLSHSHSSLAKGISDAFAGQCSLLLATGTDVASSSVFNTPLSGAGTVSSGLPLKSPTNLWTDTLEKARFDSLNRELRSLPSASRHANAVLSFINVDRYSSQFLTTPPDSIGFLDDPKFLVSFSNYLGLPCPIATRFSGRFLAHCSRSVQIDVHGNSLASFNALPGGHQLALHREVQHSLSRLIRSSGLTNTLEANNLFDGLVPDPIMARYHSVYQLQNVRSRDAIIPDILIDQFPHKAQSLTGGMHSISLPAIIEVKGVRVCGSKYGRRPRSRAQTSYLGPSDSAREVDIRAQEVKAEYANRVLLLDQRFSPSESSTPDEASGIPGLQGPFTAAYRHSFFSGGVVPGVIGHFSEVNQELDDLVISLASNAARRSCPSASSSSATKSTFSTLVAEYRRVLGMTMTRSNASLKLCRLPYAARTADESRLRSAAQVPQAPRAPSLHHLPSYFHCNLRDAPVYQAWSAFRSRSHRIHAAA